MTLLKRLLVISLFLPLTIMANSLFQTAKYATTKNGMRWAYIKIDHLPIVDIRLAFHAGSAYDGEHDGLAKLSASLIGNGTTELDADQVASQFDALGAQMSNRVGRDLTIFSLRTLSAPAVLKQAVPLFVNSIVHLSLMPHDFTRLQNDQLQVIALAGQNPQTLAFKTLFESLFAGSPYAHAVSGSPASVSAITMGDVHQFYQKYYVAKNADLDIVGDISYYNAAKLAEQISRYLKIGQRANAIVVHAKTPLRTVIHVPFPGKQSTILVARLGLSKLNKNRLKLGVLAQILGGSGEKSLLSKALREDNGLVYHVEASNLALASGGIFYAFAQTANSNTQKALTMMGETMNKMSVHGVSASKLKRAQDYISGSFPLAFTTNASIANMLLSLLAFDYPKNYLSTYVQKIKKLTPGNISGVFENIIHSEPRIIIIVGEK